MARRALQPGQLPTSELVLEAAARGFGQHGFEGLSLRDLGTTLGITAPTLLHHAGSKRKLYARVLAHITASLGAAIAARAAEIDADDDKGQVLGLLDAYLAWSREHDDYARLLMRELLDNRERVARSKYWPLATLVQQVTTRVQRVRGGTVTDAAMTVFQAIGAIAYYAAADTTLRKVLGTGVDGDLDEPFRVAMRRSIVTGLRAARALSLPARTRARP